MKLRPTATGMLVLGAALCGLAVQPVALTAQSVQGRVIDVLSDAPIVGAAITLTDSAGTRAGSTVSGDDGVFTIGARRSGFYSLSVEREGYNRSTTPSFGVPQDGVIEVELRMSVRPFELSPLHIISSGPAPDRRLAAWGYYQRELDFRNRYARFFSREDIEEANVSRVSELMREITEFRVERRGHDMAVLTRRGARIPLYINGTLVRGGGLDEWISAANVAGMEVYWRGAPLEYGGGAAIVIWTGGGHR
jgi:hypothetical protein